MLQVDVGSIVPSTRDLLQVIATRKKSMALIALLGEERPAEEAARLHELNVSAFACAEPSAAMQLAARATKTAPMLCLRPAKEREDFLAARFCGADGVCIDADIPLTDWDKLARGARTTRMLPLAVAHDAAGVEAAVKAGVRVLMIQAPSAAELIALTAGVPRTMTLVAAVEGADAAVILALRGHVDAAVVPPSLHQAKDFDHLVAEVDP